MGFLTFLKNIVDLFKFIAGYVQSVFVLASLKPDLIFSKGGYVSLPIVLAGAFWQIPIIVHESDITPGLANRIAFRFVRRIAFGFPLLSYPKKYHEKGVYCGIPLRPEFFENWQRPVKEGGYLLVFGGSSGAQNLNDKVFATAPELLKEIKIVHVTGADDVKRAGQFRKTLPDKLARRYESYGFVYDISNLIYRSSAVVMRAGATAIAEVGACRKKALLVPLDERVGGHQRENAIFAQKAGLAGYLSNGSSPNEFLKAVKDLLKSDDTKNLEKMYFPFSAQVLAQIVNDELLAAQFRKTRRFFLIGICGVSMSALAKVLRDIGRDVEGSDIKLGGHSAQNIEQGFDGVVYTSAANREGAAKEEFAQAEKLGVPLIKRSQMIGTLMRGKKGITVSGMHGKTSVSSIIARIFESEYPETSYLIGAPRSASNEVASYGAGGYFVVEACEYDSSFLDFPSEVAVITNIEKEHLDYFKNLEAIKKAYENYIDNIYPGGTLVYCADDKIAYELVKKKYDSLQKKRISVISYGFKPTSDIFVKDYKVEKGEISFSLNILKKSKLDFNVNIPGKHFALNCAAAAGVALSCGIEELTIIKEIGLFRGASRRFQKIGQNKKVIVYDDYGHHPTEILSTSKALAELYKDEAKILVYQPHQQSRFNELYEDFVKSFELAPVSRVVILPVYRVEGRDQKEIYTSHDLADRINKSKHDKAIYIEDYNKAADYLGTLTGQKNIVMTMGATDVWKVGDILLKKG